MAEATRSLNVALASHGGAGKTSLAEALKTHPDKVEAALFQAVYTEDKFAAQNSAFFTHGAFLYVPAGLEDFVNLLVPELQRRGIFRKEYEGTTLREHLGLKRPANRFFP